LASGVPFPESRKNAAETVESVRKRAGITGKRVSHKKAQEAQIAELKEVRLLITHFVPFVPSVPFCG
jgi:hypothetical protein